VFKKHWCKELAAEEVSESRWGAWLSLPRLVFNEIESHQTSRVEALFMRDLPSLAS
jgi:hypothetical protein